MDGRKLILVILESLDKQISVSRGNQMFVSHFVHSDIFFVEEFGRNWAFWRVEAGVTWLKKVKKITVFRSVLKYLKIWSYIVLILRYFHNSSYG